MKPVGEKEKHEKTELEFPPDPCCLIAPKLEACPPCPNTLPCLCNTVVRDIEASTTNADIDHSNSNRAQHHEPEHLLRLENAWKNLFAGKKFQIWCISLMPGDQCLANQSPQVEAQKIRHEQVVARIHAAGLCRLIKFFRPSRPCLTEIEKHQVKSRGAYGCWTSHQKLAQYSLMLGLEEILLLEDDFHLVSQFETHLMRAAQVKTQELSDSMWDIFYLGHFPFKGYPVTFDLSLWRTYSLMTHAYILSHRGMTEMAKLDYFTHCHRHNHIDNIIKDSHLVQYAYSPQFIVQTGETSQNTHFSDRRWYKINDSIEFWSYLHRQTIEYTGQLGDTIMFLAVSIFCLLLGYIAFCLMRKAIRYFLFPSTSTTLHASPPPAALPPEVSSSLV